MNDNITTETNGQITIELVETNFFTRWPCTVCGGCTEKVAMLAEGQDEHGKIRVCENCLENGDIDEHLAKHADTLGAQAELVRKLIGRLKVPTFAEWIKAERDHNVLTIMEHDEITREEAETRVHPDWPAVSHEEHERWLCNAPGAIINEREQMAADQDSPIPF